mmetsp:Transcript_16719/g.49965  ORF Transcript_16719/g.49965 Transcript_16719/m.49965 type:complete len:396 (-) Transcript_16719:2076-3263(-)
MTLPSGATDGATSRCAARKSSATRGRNAVGSSAAAAATAASHSSSKAVSSHCCSWASEPSTASTAVLTASCCLLCDVVGLSSSNTLLPSAAGPALPNAGTSAATAWIGSDWTDLSDWRLELGTSGEALACVSSLLPFAFAFTLLPEAASSSRTGRMAAATHSWRRSLPEKPSVVAAISAMLTSGCSSSPSRMTWRMAWRAGRSGRSQKRRREKRRSTASSRSPGLLVAPSTMTRGAAAVVAERMPSHWAISSFFISRSASCSLWELRFPSSASTSSMNTTHGDSLAARLNSALTYLTPSPNHLDASVDGEMARKDAPHSAAAARASKVLPVPGGPKRRTPLQGRARAPREKRRGCCSGSCTVSLRASLVPASAPTSLNPFPDASGDMTSASRRRS